MIFIQDKKNFNIFLWYAVKIEMAQIGNLYLSWIKLYNTLSYKILKNFDELNPYAYAIVAFSMPRIREVKIKDLKG